MSGRPHVGTLRERPLHAALKRWYAEEGDRIEEPVDGFVIDIVRDDLLVEIQTSGFRFMKRKLAKLLDQHPVRIVYPVATEKWIVKIGDGGEVISRRKSPKRGAVVDVFGELVSFPRLMAHPGLSLEVLTTRQEEIRRFDPDKAWRRKHWVIEERRLLEVIEQQAFELPEDLAGLLPEQLPGEFTTADVAGALGCSRRTAQQMAYCLRNLGIIERIGKTGNAVTYARVAEAPPRMSS